MGSPDVSADRSLVLIETYWNVNHFLFQKRNAEFCINRNILECKYTCYQRTSFWETPSINRNILECKFWKLLTDAVRPERINRNILECKWFHSADDLCQYFVLIETYWNVNFAIVILAGPAATRINRNILECKSWYNFARCKIGLLY